MRQKKSGHDCIDLNNNLSELLWMDFGLGVLNGAEAVLSGRMDEAGGKELFRITFIEPFMICCPLYFTYDNGPLIVEATGQEFIRMNVKYNVTKGNKVFKLYIGDNRISYFIIAKQIKWEQFE